MTDERGELGVALEDISERVRKELADVPRHLEFRRKLPTGITERDLRRKAFPDPRWLTTGVLPLEGLTLFAGAPKIGKSLAAVKLAIASARGGYAFGTVRLPHYRVGHFGLEDPERRLKRRSI